MYGGKSKMFGIKLKDIFSEAIALDLGTVNTLAALRGRGIVLREPTAVAVSTGEEREILEIGTRAMLMLGRTPGGVTVEYPMRDGVITNLDLAEAVIKYCVESVMGRRTALAGMKLALCLPLCVSDVERRALVEAAKSAGARDMMVLNEALAAAIGAGLPVSAPVGSMVVDVGGGTTDSAVIAMGGVAAHRSVRVGGTHIDRAITEYIAKEYRLSIGERTAEQIKLAVGSAYIGGGEHMEVRGRNMDSGLPDRVIVTQSEVSYAMIAPVRAIVNAVKETLADTPPELAGDIFTRGIWLTGGGAMLNGLSDMIRNETGMGVQVAENAADCVVVGALKALDMQAELESMGESVSA